MYCILFFYNPYIKKQHILNGFTQYKYSIGLTSKELNSHKTQYTLQQTPKPIQFSSV